MIFGTMHQRQSKLLWMLLLWMLCGVVGAQDWDEAKLLAALARSASPAVNFVEVRHFTYLDMPLQSRGQLEFRSPDYLRRTVNDGGTFEIYADRLSMTEKNGARREISLDALPGLRVFSESFRATLTGDVVRLHRYFHAELIGEQSQWELRLTPHDANLSAAIEHVSLFGSGGQIGRIETYERNGDYTVTRLEQGRD